MEWEVLIGGYLGHLRSGGYPRTTVETRRQHRHFLARRIEAKPTEVTRAVLTAWCSEQGWKPETRRGRNNTFRYFWRWCADQRELEDISDALPTVRQRHRIPRVTPDEVYAQAISAADTRTRLILRLAAECGLRRAEIACINVDRDLIQDFIGWSLIVQGKGDRQRLVPLPASIALELQDMRTGWAFPGAVSGHLSAVWIGRLATQVLADGWTLHTLRARFATKVYQVDRDVFAVQELLGHASPETTRRYVLTDSGRLRSLLEQAAL